MNTILSEEHVLPKQQAQWSKGNKGFACTYMGTLLVMTIVAAVLNWFGNDSFSANERVWKTNRLDELVREGNKPEVIFLGDSRMFQMDPEYVHAITGKRAFNYSVTSATIVDSLTQLRYALRIGIKPDILILGLEDWPGTWNGQTNTFESGLLGHSGLFADVPYPENLSLFAGFLPQCNLGGARKGLYRLLGLRQRESPEILNLGYAAYLKNGYLIHTELEKRKADGTFDVHVSIENSMSGIGPLWEKAIVTVHERWFGYLRELLDLADSESIQVRVVVLPTNRPWKQRYYENSEVVRERRDEVIKRMCEECRRHNYSFYDFTCLDSFHGDSNEFWDGTHMTPTNMRKVVDAVFNVDPHSVVIRLPTDLQRAKELSLY